MNRKRWAFFILCFLLLAGYYKFFYKTWGNDTVAKNSDCIIAIDVKSVTNTLIWNFITTVSQWKTGSIFSSSEAGKVSWDDMVKIPDYIFVFHVKGQPINAWYTVLEIRDKDDFNKGLQQFHFEKRNNGNLYFSDQTGIQFIQSGDKLLAGNLAVQDNRYIRQLADELFTKKQFIPRQTLKQNIDAASHLSIQIAKNNLFEKDALLTANFDKNSITIDAELSPARQFSFTQNNFNYSDSSLYTMAFTQPSPALYGLFPDSLRGGISRAMNFNIDSLLQPTNFFYQLDITGLQPRMDTAISYTYDDNFNPVEKVVLHNVIEPAFNFTVNGNAITSTYNYWNKNGKLEKSGAGELFVPMPFVKSYCNINKQQELAITSYNYRSSNTTGSVGCIFFLNLLLTKIPAPLLQYFPRELIEAINNIESVQLILKKEKEQLILHGSFNKKKNDLPLFEWKF